MDELPHLENNITLDMTAVVVKVTLSIMIKGLGEFRTNPGF